MRLTSYYKFTGIFIKLAIIAVSLWYIYKQVNVKANIHTDDFLLINSTRDYLLITLVLFLMILNWSLEAFKWRLLISGLEKITFIESLQAILAGVTVSIFAPNRTGEFAGRVFYLEKSDRIQASLQTFVGSIIQLLVTIIAASIAIGFHQEKLNLPKNLIFYLLISCGIVVLLAFSLKKILKIYSSKQFISNYKKHITAFRDHTIKDLGIVFFLSALRYIIFTGQYFILLNLFEVNISLFKALVFIPLIFFAISAIPTFALTEIGIRGAAALYFLAPVSGNETEILASSFTLWLINIAIPALAGTFCILRLKIFRT